MTDELISNIRDCATPGCLYAADEKNPLCGGCQEELAKAALSTLRSRKAMTSKISTPRHVRMNLSRAAPSAKFQLGSEVFFTAPIDKEGNIEETIHIGKVIARAWNTENESYKYDVDDSARWWFNVPESQLQQVEKLPVSKE